MKRSRTAGALALAAIGMCTATALDSLGHHDPSRAALIATAAGFAILLILEMCDEIHAGRLGREVLPAAGAAIVVIAIGANTAVVTVVSPAGAGAAAVTCAAAAAAICTAASLTRPRGNEVEAGGQNNRKVTDSPDRRERRDHDNA